jgi:hypothetical protein
MSIIITKNSATDLNIFFYKSGLTNVHAPNISYLRVDDASNVTPAFSIGFSVNLGYLDSFKVTSGTVVFEVLDGYPMQDLIFALNKRANKSHTYSLQDLPPLDLYCLNKNGEDEYGDFILKNVKFISTKLEQGVQTPGRMLVANFITSGIVPYLQKNIKNNFISDNYSNHTIKNESEIASIKQDLEATEISDKEYNLLYKLLSTSTNYKANESSSESKESKLVNVLKYNYAKFVASVKLGKINYTYRNNMKNFIKEFYEYKEIIDGTEVTT